MLWLDGGPSHMDLYDLKPEAPAEYRGLWNPIRTNVPGMEISELFPLQAKVADKFSIIRSLHHDNGDHFTGGHFMLTSRGGASGANNAGRNPVDRLDRQQGLRRRAGGMPAYVAVPIAASIGLRPGYFGANYLGMSHNPFETNGDPNSPNFTVDNIQLANAMTVERLEDRRGLLAHFDRMRRELDNSGTMDIDGPLRSRAPTTWSSAARPARRSTCRSEDAGHARPLRPHQSGAKARCSPAGWSKPAPPSSPSTWAAGTITGI